MAEKALVDEAADVLEHRQSVRRASDRWMYGIVIALCGTIFLGGVAWGTTTARISAKLDKTEFTDFTKDYNRDRALDSMSNRNRDSLMIKIDRKLSRVLCPTNPRECE